MVITGGTGLLGKKHVEVVAECKGNPVILDVNPEKGAKVADQVSKSFSVDCQYFNCDITNESILLDTSASILKTFKTIDVLINNAAVDPKVGLDKGKNLSRFENYSRTNWDFELAVGLTGAMLCSKIFGNEMAKNGKGVILNIASDLGVIAPDQRLYKKEGCSDDEQPTKPVTYSVIKHGLIGLTKYLATYWADKNIRANSISPGGVYTNQEQGFVDKLTQLIPLGRMAKQDEYKAAVLFLISDASSYMTGANLVVDGGRTCW